MHPTFWDENWGASGVRSSFIPPVVDFHPGQESVEPLRSRLTSQAICSYVDPM
jgi:hypothetical protein